ncbi:MAG: M28 family peptidase [Sphingobacteriales bacterium]|jgi:aminopeptidase YwaD|nr:M28 family peptidase [Sphingobacteriales bacterium]
MNKITNCFIILAILLFGQNVVAQESTLERNLKKHISFLADDKLEGRRAGTVGEQKAMVYIAGQFKKSGLQPKGVKAFLQPFEINEGKRMGDGAYLQIGGKKLISGQDYFILPYSGTKTFDFTCSNQITTKNHLFVSIDSILTQANSNPHFDATEALYKKALDAEQNGASEIFFYNSSNQDDLRFNKRDKSATLKIPVVYLNSNTYKHYIELTGQKKINGKAEIVNDIRIGHNVVGYIDNKAKHTVILGAHFDHLGYGEDGNSMLRTGERLIHNGADDNASGTAALIELSSMLKKPTLKNNNYLFIAFSGEELGLYGSKYFVENPTIDLNKVNYMINMDMVGRLNDSTKTLTIGGYGTSPSWSEVIKENRNGGFSNKIDSSGSGPSDHTSFYRKDIPVLFYFTGLHHDYHKPSDDYDKINYKGEALIIENIYDVVKQLNNSPKLAFLKTREVQVSTTSFKVTMGIMPDYTFSGEGVKADGVTDGRPAAKAGIKGGDIILGLGDYPIHDMESYMKALNKFKKGDATTVKFKRGDEIMKAEITF